MPEVKMKKTESEETPTATVPSTQSIFGITFQSLTSKIDSIASRIPWFAWFLLGITSTFLYGRRGSMKKLLTKSED